MPEQRRILVVDDDDAFRRIMRIRLEEMGHEVLEAQDGEGAVKAATEHAPDLILMDRIMPRMDGLQATKLLRSQEATEDVPIVIVSAVSDMRARVEVLEAGADDSLAKPFHLAELTARVTSLLNSKAYHDHMRRYQRELEGEVEARTEELRLASEEIRRASVETVLRLARAAERRDRATGHHIQRVTSYAVLLAEAIGLDRPAVEAIRYAAPMHDIGKVAIPDRILYKRGSLTPEEWEVMKTHTTIGGEILHGSSSELIQHGETIALTHHERWDGTGYPRGLGGEEIPLFGRITAVVDVFDALTSRRPYKEPFALKESFATLREGRGTQFEERLVDAFLGLRDDVCAIRTQFQAGAGQETDIVESLPEPADMPR